MSYQGWRCTWNCWNFKHLNLDFLNPWILSPSFLKWKALNRETFHDGLFPSGEVSFLRKSEWIWFISFGWSQACIQSSSETCSVKNLWVPYKKSILLAKIFPIAPIQDGEKKRFAMRKTAKGMKIVRDPIGNWFTFRWKLPQEIFLLYFLLCFRQFCYWTKPSGGNSKWEIQ